MYKYEMHLHTTACSPCAVSPMESYVYRAKELGYAGFGGTNPVNFRWKEESGLSLKDAWEAHIQRYIDDWKTGYELGQTMDVDVLFGVEAGIGHGKEALIYGLDPSALKKEYRFSQYSTREKSEFVHAHGAWFVAAHPFRHRWYITEEDAETPRAQALADEHGLAGLGGGDVHDVGKFGNSGMAFEKRLRSQDDLLEALKEGTYRILIRGQTGLPIE